MAPDTLIKLNSMLLSMEDMMSDLKLEMDDADELEIGIKGLVALTNGMFLDELETGIQGLTALTQEMIDEREDQ